MVRQSLVRDSLITRFNYVDPDRRVLTRLECRCFISHHSKNALKMPVASVSVKFAASVSILHVTKICINTMLFCKDTKIEYCTHLPASKML